MGLIRSLISNTTPIWEEEEAEGTPGQTNPYYAMALKYRGRWNNQPERNRQSEEFDSR
jgi:hypothetical protein